MRRSMDIRYQPGLGVKNYRRFKQLSSRAFAHAIEMDSHHGKMVYPALPTEDLSHFKNTGLTDASLASLEQLENELEQVLAENDGPSSSLEIPTLSSQTIVSSRDKPLHSSVASSKKSP